MKTDWRTTGTRVVGVGVLVASAIGLVVDVGELLSWRSGDQWLGAVVLFVLLYALLTEGPSLWPRSPSLRARLDAVRDQILMRAGTASRATVLLYAQARWFRERQKQIIRVSAIRPDGLLVVDLSGVRLRGGDNLFDTHWSIVGEAGERGRGTVATCDGSQACLRLYQGAGAPTVGDVAVPLLPPNASDVERLLGELLYVASE